MVNIKITDLIPYGYDNAISRKDLVIQAEQNHLVEGATLVEMDRLVRRLVQKARERGTVILYRNQGGYYQPTNDDEKHIRRYIASERAKAQTLYRETYYAEKLLDDIAAGLRIGESNE